MSASQWSITSDGLIQEGPHNTPVARMVSPSLMAGSLIEWEAKRDLIIRSLNSHEALVKALEAYIENRPAFRSKPMGSPGSNARKEQEMEIALEDAARAALKLAKP